jgi:hypothetical protein
LAITRLTTTTCLCDEARLAKKPKRKRLWPGRWYREAAEMLRKDLDQAGIEYKTNEGYLDFHATRHTAITRGSKVIRIVDLKTYARHAKLETTMRYCHTDTHELREQVNALPTIGANNAAPADDKNVAGDGSKKCVRKCVALLAQPVNVRHHVASTVTRPETTQPLAGARGCHRLTSTFISERDGTRTRNHRIDSPVL